MAMKGHDRFSRWLCASCESSCNCYHHCYHRLRRTGSAGAGGGLAKQRRRASAAVGDEEESYYPSVVRTVLAGGVVELYSAAVPAREVMERHPGLCVARPEVFSSPEEALVGPKEKLLPGEKFYLIPYTTVRKLKQRRRRAEGGGAGAAHLVDLKAAMAADKGGAEEADDEEEKVLSANDFYVSRERWRQCGARRRLLWEAGRRVSEGPTPTPSTPTPIPIPIPIPPPPPPPLPPPPLQVGRGAGRGLVPLRRRKMCRKKGLGWKPNLESIQEVSL